MSEPSRASVEKASFIMFGYPDGYLEDDTLYVAVGINEKMTFRSLAVAIDRGEITTVGTGKYMRAERVS